MEYGKHQENKQLIKDKKIMKKLSLYIFMVLMLCNVGFADDIKNFEIEGMRVGESALNYFTKEEIEKMALLQFPKVRFDRSDEADALAIAVCHIHTLKINANLNSAMKKAM